MRMSLEKKTAIVTGSTRGIGRAVAVAMLDEGGRVLINARTQAEVDKTVTDLAKDYPGQVEGTACDVRDYASVKKVFAYADEKLGGLDILVNNAGIGVFGNLADLPVEAWKQCMETNLNGVFFCCKEGIPRMKARGGGYIINISSLAGRNAFPGATAYNASKFGLNGFTEALMQEVRYDDIRVSHVAPGSVDTEFSGRLSGKSGWALLPEDVARVVLDLLKHDPRSLPSYVEIRPSKPPRK